MPLAYLCPELADGLDRVSVFETMRSYGGRVFQFDRHYERLTESCRALSETVPLDAAALKRWIGEAIAESGHADATLRVSLHWEDKEGRIQLFVTPFKSHPAPWYERGVSLRTAVPRRWTLRSQDPQIKASQYVGGVMALLDLVGAGLKPAPTEPHELVFFGSGGTVAEGAVSNLFIVKGRRLLTPSASSGILKGVTRGIVMELARKRGWSVTETELTRHEFYSADECFLTNTSSEVLPVVRLDGRAIGGGKPGPCTRLLAKDFKKLR